MSHGKWSVKVTKPHWWHLQRLSPPMDGGEKRLSEDNSQDLIMRIAALQKIWHFSPGKSAMTMSVASLGWGGPTDLEMGTSELMQMNEPLKHDSEPCGPAEGALSSMLRLCLSLAWTRDRSLCIARQHTIYLYSHSYRPITRVRWKQHMVGRCWACWGGKGTKPQRGCRIQPVYTLQAEDGFGSVS